MPGVTQAATGKKTDLSPQQALDLLKEGNKRCVTDSSLRAVQGRNGLRGCDELVAPGLDLDELDTVSTPTPSAPSRTAAGMVI